MKCFFHCNVFMSLKYFISIICEIKFIEISQHICKTLYKLQGLKHFCSQPTKAPQKNFEKLCTFSPVLKITPKNFQHTSYNCQGCNFQQIVNVNILN